MPYIGRGAVTSSGGGADRGQGKRGRGRYRHAGLRFFPDVGDPSKGRGRRGKPHLCCGPWCRSQIAGFTPTLKLRRPVSGAKVMRDVRFRRRTEPWIDRAEMHQPRPVLWFSQQKRHVRCPK